MASKSPLHEYQSKRDFRKTKEPRGKTGRKGGRRFVIQEHDASTLHYDLRLEVGGVLKSWAVPKGPSTDPRERRLALPTEDHPLDYAGFEGVIPEDQYGGGAVIVWDEGTYANIKEADDDGGRPSLEEQIDHGHALFALDGEKLQGGYALTRVAKGKKPRWLLVKMKDAGADARRNPVSTQPESVRSGRTVEQVAEEANGDDS